MGKNLKRIISTAITGMFSISILLAGGEEANAETIKLSEEALKLMALDQVNSSVKATDGFSGIETAKQDSENINIKSEGSPEETIRIIVEVEGQAASEKSKIINEAEIQQIIDEQQDVQAQVENITDNAVKNSYGNLINGFSIDAKREDIEEIAALDGVVRVSEANIYYPTMATAVDITEASKVWEDYGYDGEGLVVAIIDTGIDYTHKDMRNPSNYDAMKLKEEDITEGPGRYYSDKVPYGYNFADGNDEIIDTTGSMHGMHVAGIVAANASDEDYESGEGVRGAAPDAQLLAMKVFTNNPEVSGAYSDDIIAAIEDSVLHGADIINMSLGSNSGFRDSEDPEQIAIKNATDAGVLCVVSAGNSYYSTYPYWFGAMNDVSTAGAPGIAEDALQVASYENNYVKLDAFMLEAEGTNKLIGYTFPDIDPNSVFSPEEKLTFVHCGLGTVDEIEAAGDLTGKVALIERGSIAFTEKTLNAQNAGAAMVVVYNNESGGDTYINMATDPEIKIPYVFVTNTDGKYIKSVANEGKIYFDSFTTTVTNTVAGELSDFTSWGPSPDLGFAPQISSPGGNIYSTVNNDKYTTMSGTSMAAPNAAGCSALIIQALKENNIDLSGRELVEFVKNSIINTADILMDIESYGEGSEVPYSPRRQGSGLIQTEETLKNRVLAVGEDGKATISLKEIGNNTSFTITLKNYGSDDETYNVALNSGVLTTEDAGFGVSGYMVYDIILDGADVTFDKEQVTVPAGGETTITATLTIPKDAKKDIFAEGFITLTAEDEDTSSLVVPFMGFYGSWSSERIINDVAWDFNAENILPPSFAAVSVLGDYNYAGYDGRDEYGDVVFDEEKIAISPNGDEYGDQLLPVLYMLRNAKEVAVDILDKNYEIVAKNVALDSYVRRQIFNSSDGSGQGALIRNTLAWDGKLYNKSTGEYDVIPGEYIMSIKSKVDLDTAVEQCVNIPVKVDITEPEITMISSEKCEGKEYELKIKISDDLAGVDNSSIIIAVNGEEVTATIEDDIVTANTSLIEDSTNIIEVGVFDNAYNFAYGNFSVQAGEIKYTEPTITLDKEDSDMFTSADIVINGEVTGSYGKVSIAGQDVKVQGDGSFSVPLTLEEGRNYISVYMEDINGKVITNHAIKLYLDTTAPVITLNVPYIVGEDTITISSNKLVLEGSVYDNIYGYDFYINGEKILNVNLDGAYGEDTTREFSKELQVENGDIVELKAIDMFGNETVKKYKVIIDESAPEIQIEGVENGKVYNVDISAKVTVNEPFKIVSVTLNGEEYNGDTISQEGEYVLKVMVTADGIVTYESEVKFTIDKTAPVIEINNVEDGGIYNKDIAPDIVVSEDSIVSILLNGKEYNSEVITEEGNYSMEVTAVDEAGNKAVKAISFVIDKTAPEITIKDVVNGMKYNKNVKPSVEVNEEASIEATLNGEPYNFDEITENGSYTLKVVATDKAGNSSEKEVIFTIEKEENKQENPTPTPNPNPGQGTGGINTPPTDDSNSNGGNGSSKVNTTVINGKGSIPKTGNESAIYITAMAIILVASGATLVFTRKKHANS